MKIIKSLFLILFCSSMTNAQDAKIDSSNYCNFYDDRTPYPEIKSYRLTETMVIDIVSDEMEKLGYKWINDYRIIKIDSGSYITSICYSDKSNCGFLLEKITELAPDQRNRNVVSLEKKLNGFDYGEKIVHLDGTYEFVKIQEIPTNLHILKIADYFYQTSGDQKKNRKLVSKEFITELLRNDVRKFLAKIKP